MGGRRSGGSGLAANRFLSVYLHPHLTPELSSTDRRRAGLSSLFLLPFEQKTDISRNLIGFCIRQEGFTDVSGRVDYI